MDEKKIQELISNFPWLLDFNYESIPELEGQGMEYRLPNWNRIDLILRDRISKRPVIVEFKAIPFYRENIGQIADYRASVLMEISNENSKLKSIFENMLFCPLLCLVVPSCDESARIACALSGIEVYEYETEIKRLEFPEDFSSLHDFEEKFKNTPLPFDGERETKVIKIYERIKEILARLNCSEYWTNYKRPAGEYWDNINHSFINKWLCQGKPISIGIYELIFDKNHYNQIGIQFFSYDVNNRDKFAEAGKDVFETLLGESEKEEFVAVSEYYWKFYLPLDKFINELEDLLKKVISKYIETMVKIRLLEGDENINSHG